MSAKSIYYTTSKQIKDYDTVFWVVIPCSLLLLPSKAGMQLLWNAGTCQTTWCHILIGHTLMMTALTILNPRQWNIQLWNIAV